MSAPKTNLLLDSLSPENREVILSQAKQMPLGRGESLNAQETRPRFVYFLTSGIASIVVEHIEGATSEISLIGNEGMTGALSILGPSAAVATCYMQLAGSAYQVSFSAMQDLFARSEEIRNRILHCVQQQAMTTSQIAACNATHEAESRLARWLLMVQDRTQEDTFQLTQEFVAQMLGARRTTVAIAAGTLQRSGFIEYSRGKMTILSREALRNAACECYDVTYKLYSNLYR